MTGIVSTDRFEIGLTGQKYTLMQGTNGLDVWLGPADAPTSLMGTITSGGFQAPRLEMAELYNAGSGPGASVAGWQVRQINSTLKNTIPGATNNGGGSFTLPAGTYRFQGSAPAYSVGRHLLAITRPSDGSDMLFGRTAYMGASSTDCQTDAFIDGYVTLAATTTLLFRHYTVTAVSVGLGVTAISSIALASRLSITKEA